MSRADRGPGTRPGIALAVTVLALVILAALTSVLFTLAVQETRLTRARADAARARFAAESGVLAALAGWRTERHLDLAVGAPRALTGAMGELAPGVRNDVGIERLDVRTYLVRGLGVVEHASEGVRARSRAGVLVRVVPPTDLWRSFSSALTVGGRTEVRSGAHLDAGAGGSEATPPPGATPGSCRAAESAFDELFRDRSLSPLRAPDAALVEMATGASVTGDPAFVIDPGLGDVEAFDRLGSLGTEQVAGLADRHVAGELELPGTDASELTVAPGDLVLAGGTGGGVLIVLGDLTVRSGVRFHGPVYVRGRLVLESDAEIHGAARVAGSERTSIVAGTIAYSACALDYAFRQSDALGRPFRPSGRWWIPLF